jgi:RNase P subunit RPR2
MVKMGKKRLLVKCEECDNIVDTGRSAATDIEKSDEMKKLVIPVHCPHCSFNKEYSVEDIFILET